MSEFSSQRAVALACCFLEGGKGAGFAVLGCGDCFLISVGVGFVLQRCGCCLSIACLCVIRLVCFCVYLCFDCVWLCVRCGCLVLLLA